MKKEKKETPCRHENETPFMTTDKRYCKKCGKIYYSDPAPIDFKKVAQTKCTRF